MLDGLSVKTLTAITAGVEEKSGPPVRTVFNKGHTGGMLEKFSVDNERICRYGERNYHMARTLNFLGARLPIFISGTTD